MFYEEEQLSKKLVCPNCNRRFDEPKMLPCANLICQRCIETISETLGSHLSKFTCPLCGDYHDFPSNKSFPVCKPIKELLSQQPREVYRGAHAESLKLILNQVRTNASELDGDINASLNQIKQRFQLLRKEVNQATESAYKHIKESNLTMIKEIDEYESQLIKPFEVNKHSQSEIAFFIEEIKQFQSQWERYFV